MEILCKKTFQSAKLLSEATRIPRTFAYGNLGRPTDTTEVLINWGIFGNERIKYLNKYPQMNDAHIINSQFPGDKYMCVCKAKDAGVPVPKSVMTRTQLEGGGWIFKPLYSAHGRGIVRVGNGENIPDGAGYLQKEIYNRKYEVRVSAFRWMPHEKWGIWKKMHSDPTQLTWNHDTGGVFELVDPPHNYPLFKRLKKHVTKLLEVFDLDFGAFDFIIGPDWDEYFLEVNTRPGFTQYGLETYKQAIEDLQAIQPDEIRNRFNNMFAFTKRQFLGEEESMPNEIEQVAATVDTQEPVELEPEPRITGRYTGLFRAFDPVDQLREPLCHMLAEWARVHGRRIDSCQGTVNQMLEVLYNV